MGLYVDDKPMGKKELLEFLKLPKDAIPGVRRKVIQVNTRQVDRDKHRPPKSVGGKPEYLIFVPHLEREIKIRFATSQRKDKDENFIYPFPRTLTLFPAEDGSVLIKDEMEFLFWFLRPMCLQSPFHDKQKPYTYAFQDNDKKATDDMEREEQYINAMNIIVGNNCWTDVQLKHLAKGLHVQGVDDMTPMVVKAELKKIAFKDPVGFFNKANSREVLFSGKIQEAIDRDVLNLKSVNGMQRWYLKEREILPIGFGQDPLTELKNHMAERWYLYQDEIQKALENITISTYLDNAINDEAFDKNEAKAIPNRIRAELTAEQHALLKKIKELDWLEAKMRKIDTYDLTNPKLNPKQRESYEGNKHYYQAWLAGKAAGEIDEIEENPETVVV